jgi:hypothetical protein
LFSTDDPDQQNEKTARFTFYNESVTQRVIRHSNLLTSTDSFAMDGQEFRIGKAGDQFRINLVGDPDPGGKVNGKFAGYAVGLSSHENQDR